MIVPTRHLQRVPENTSGILVQPLPHGYSDGGRRKRAYECGEPEGVEPYCVAGRGKWRSGRRVAPNSGIDERGTDREPIELTRYHLQGIEDLLALIGLEKFVGFHDECCQYGREQTGLQIVNNGVIDLQWPTYEDKRHVDLRFPAIYQLVAVLFEDASTSPPTFGGVIR